MHADLRVGDLRNTHAGSDSERWSRKAVVNVPAQLHSGEAGLHLHCLDQQHLPGDEPADPVEDLFSLIKKGVAVVRMPLLLVMERLVRYQLALDTLRRSYLYQMATY